MEETPLISVIVPVYNAEKYIENCVQSLLSQTYTNLEILLVDDGSKDQSLEICRKLAERYPSVRAFHKDNGGVASARNYGIARARGAYIGFMDNDDYIEPDMFETLVTELEGSSFSVAQILVENVDEEGKVVCPVQYQNEYLEVILAKTYLKDLLLQKANLTCWSKLFRRDVLEKYTFVDGRWNEDFLLLFRIFSDKNYDRLLSINKVGYHYVQRKGSYSKSGFNQGIVDNVMNAEWFITQCEDAELKLCAYRLFFHQLIPYYLFITDAYKQEYQQQYQKWMRTVWREKKQWMKNPYLTAKEKILLTGMMVCPRLLLSVVKRINYKGYFR